MTDNRRGFLHRVRLRIRLAWFIATLQRFAPHVLISMFSVLLLDWVTPFARGLLTAFAIAVAFLVTLVVRSLTMRITDWDASRAAERGLGARDTLTTALEFDDPDQASHRMIQTRADVIAEESTSSDAIPIHADRRRLSQVAWLGALVIAIGLLPPLGSSPALSSDLETAVEAEADKLEELAEAARQTDVENAEEIAAELERLAEELRQAETLEDAFEALENSDQRLEANIDPAFLAQKAAVQGLARDLALRPITDGALDASSQFEQAAESLDELSEQELRALEDRLSDLAGSQAAGNPTLSSQLSQAAQALGSGDLERAAEALRNASSSQNQGISEAREQQALAETRRALDGVSARLGGAAREGQDGQGEGQGQGQGEGQGQGQGEGQGEGQGQGQGQGQGGQGGQAGSGSPGGAIGGVQPGDGGAQGQGGQGTVSGVQGEDLGTSPDTASVYDPIAEGGFSDLIQVGIDGGSGDGSVIGRGDAPTTRGESVVPYAQVLPEYLNQAADALGEVQLPPSMRSIVQNYFDLLAEQAR